MNKEEIEKLKKLIPDFETDAVYIELENALIYNTTILNSKIIVSNERLIISDGNKQDFIVELHFLDNVEVNENTIYLNMTNDIRITLDH